MARIVMSKVAWVLEESAPFVCKPIPRSREQRLVASMQHYDMLTAREMELARWEKKAEKRLWLLRFLNWLVRHPWIKGRMLQRIREWRWNVSS